MRRAPGLESDDAHSRGCILPTGSRCVVRRLPAGGASRRCRRRTACVSAYGRKDYATAKQLLRPLAERGSAIAQFYLGLSYERGKSVSESEAEAVRWFRTAAEQGLAAAQAALGTRYFIGWGVQQSYREAMDWSLKAAKQGNPSAQAILGTIYESGYGVPKNFTLAYMWFTVSAHDPDFEPGTRQNLNEVARHLAPAQIAEAKVLAQHCLQSGYVDCTPALQVARRDDDATATASTAALGGIPSARTRVQLRIDRGISFVPVEINGTLKLDFALDSGASDVSIPADVFSTLKRTSTVKEADFIGQQSYVLADGSTTQRRFSSGRYSCASMSKKRRPECGSIGCRIVTG
jgi:Sel1 repeat